MRLIDTHNYEILNFVNVIHHYAILSHRWLEEEITFQDAANIKTGKGKGYEKVRKACKTAEDDGFGYIWIDTCCIDKTSSAELSEAINSMYAWYMDSTRCYAYLDDVQADSDIGSSKLFTRGWTLQELIAPSDIQFLNCNWEKIGTKASLQAALYQVTGIPGDILENANPESASIAQRMYWASKRTTTRVEDLAYCLMGIFDVNMPLPYGEGEKAFARLQEEIIKTSNDHSIFAWWLQGYDTRLFAPFPAAFYKSNDIVSISPLSFENNISTECNGTYIYATHQPKYIQARKDIVLLPCLNGMGRVICFSIKDLGGQNCEKVSLPYTMPEARVQDLFGEMELGWTRIRIQEKRPTRKRQLPMFRAAKAGNMEAVQLAHSFNMRPANVRNITEQADYVAALEVAVQEGHDTVVRLLLDMGTDPGHDALVQAAADGNMAVVWLLLERGAIADETSLVRASQEGHPMVVQLLLEKGANPSQEALELAADLGHLEVVQLLLQMGAKPSQEALEQVAESGHLEVLRLLHEMGAKPSKKALELAADFEHLEVVRLLLEMGAKLSQEVLEQVAESGHLEVVRLLLEMGAKPSQWASDRAARYGHLEVKRLLLERLS